MCNETRQKVSRAILAWVSIEAAILAENQKGIHSEDSGEGMANIAKVDLWNMIRKVHGTNGEQWLAVQAPRWSISGAVQLSESPDGHFSFSKARNVEILVSIGTAGHNQAMVLVPKGLGECLTSFQLFQGKKEGISKFEVHFVFSFRFSAFGLTAINHLEELLVIESVKFLINLIHFAQSLFALALSIEALKQSELTDRKKMAHVMKENVERAEAFGTISRTVLVGGLSGDQDSMISTLLRLEEMSPILFDRDDMVLSTQKALDRKDPRNGWKRAGDPFSRKESVSIPVRITQETFFSGSMRPSCFTGPSALQYCAAR